jgi:CMP/dCMP kinase
MLNHKIIIAIDGHSSTGKSTYAKMIASKIGYIYIDTGALYRAVTLYAIENELISKNNTIDEEKLQKSLENLSVNFKTTGRNGKSETYLNEKNVEKEIRTLKVSNKVSYIAAIPFVREFVDRRLREIGKNKGVVMDGRDIGTAVFPQAELKIFMTADPKIRAERRLNEMVEKGENPQYDEVLKNIIERDYIDEHRDTAPLRRASDAILLDNSYMTLDKQMEWFLNILSKLQ